MTKRKLPKAELSARPGLESALSDEALKRWVPANSPSAPAVRSEGEDDATISILDVIGRDFFGDGVTAKRISAALRQIGNRDVTVRINSPGGDFFEGLAIYNVLRDHPAHVTVKIVGLAASAASVIAMAGDRVEIGRSAFLMIHNVWVVSMGDKGHMREVADWLEPFDEAAIDIYHARTGIDEQELAAMLDRETWIAGKQAVENAWADAFLPADEAVSGDANQHGTFQIRAARRFDQMAARAGISNSDRQKLLADLKGGKPGAAQTGKQDAAELASVSALLDELKAI